MKNRHRKKPAEGFEIINAPRSISGVVIYPSTAAELIDCVVKPARSEESEVEDDAKETPPDKIDSSPLDRHDVNTALYKIKELCRADPRMRIQDYKTHFTVERDLAQKLTVLEVTKDFDAEPLRGFTPYSTAMKLTDVMKEFKDKESQGIFLAPLIQVNVKHITLCVFDYRSRQLFIIDSQGIKALANLVWNTCKSATASMLSVFTKTSIQSLTQLACELGLAFSPAHYICLNNQYGSTECGMYVIKYIEEIILQRYKLSDIVFSPLCKKPFSRHQKVNPINKDKFLDGYDLLLAEQKVPFYYYSNPLPLKQTYFSGASGVYFKELIDLADAVKNDLRDKPGKRG